MTGSFMFESCCWLLVAGCLLLVVPQYLSLLQALKPLLLPTAFCQLPTVKWLLVAFYPNVSIKARISRSSGQVRHKICNFAAYSGADLVLTA